jgi:sialic acid synthase SpsE
MSDVYIIAEIGSNHNGDISIAKRLIDMSVEAGCNAVKFQSFYGKDIVNKKIPSNEYGEFEIAKGKDFWYQVLDALAAPKEWYPEIKSYCEKRSIDFVATPESYEWAKYLVEEIHVPYLKIASMDITNIPMLDKISKLGVPMILSTGMATYEEIDEAVATIKNNGTEVIVLYCVSNYPAVSEDFDLMNIPTIREKFDVISGFSDHSLDNSNAAKSVLFGAKFIEKHITLARTMSGPDHSFALESDDLKDLVRSVRGAELQEKITEYDILDEKKMSEKELKKRGLYFRSLVTTKDLSEGHILIEEDIKIVRPGTGIEPKYFEKIIGKKITHDISAESVLNWSDLSKND